mmetsp:Transcript_80807/g.148872  ORF Transcript_80807/g.148872 Transcript_80807/m.148872 type:complete len:372 (+) Transcript_80807:69-1184(+)
MPWNLLFAAFVAALDFQGVALTSGSQEPKRLIIDTDMSTDCDDVAALCIAHALEDQGLAKLVAVVHNTGYPEGVGAVSSINNYYGRNGIPIGAFKGKFGSQLPGPYVKDLVSRFPGPIRNYSQVPEAVEVYRRVLAEQPDHSVTIASIGFMTNLALLLQSKPDDNSPLTGTELVALKVSTIACMGGIYPSSGAEHEWNFGGGNQENVTQPDPVSSAASSFAIAHMPRSVEVVFSGLHVGGRIFTGARLTDCSHSNNPCRQAYIDYRGAGNNRESWDPATTLLAVTGISSEYSVQGLDGRCVVNPVDGSNNWQASGDWWQRSKFWLGFKGDSLFNQSYLVLREGQNLSIARIIDELLCQPPQVRGEVPIVIS